MVDVGSWAVEEAAAVEFSSSDSSRTRGREDVDFVDAVDLRGCRLALGAVVSSRTPPFDFLFGAGAEFFVCFLEPSGFDVGEFCTEGAADCRGICIVVVTSVCGLVLDCSSSSDESGAMIVDVLFKNGVIEKLDLSPGKELLLFLFATGPSPGVPIVMSGSKRAIDRLRGF